jgi:hypothetical protein
MSGMAKQRILVGMPYITGEWNCSAANGEVPFVVSSRPFLITCIYMNGVANHIAGLAPFR